MVRILVTGDKRWTDREVIEKVLVDYLVFEDEPVPITIVHGGASGADTLAGEVGKEWGWSVDVYEADWARFGKAAGPIRNQEMVDSGIDRVFAFHDNIFTGSSGTKDCVRSALAKGIPVELHSSK